MLQLRYPRILLGEGFETLTLIKNSSSSATAVVVTFGGAPAPRVALVALA
jgi:hypothetical protein